MPCDCSFCQKTNHVNQIIESRDVDRLISLVNDLFNDLIHSEDDRDYLNSVLNGSWPSAVTLLNLAIEKAQRSPERPTNPSKLCRHYI